MQNFRLLGFLDTFEVACSLRHRMNLFRAGERGERVLPVRWMTDPEADTPNWRRVAGWDKWPELKNTIGRLARVGQIVGPIERGRMFFEMLDPGVTLPWHTQTERYFESFVRVHLPIRTNPQTMMYAGIEATNLLPGQVTLVNARAISSATNLGDWPRMHLVMDFRKVESET